MCTAKQMSSVNSVINSAYEVEKYWLLLIWKAFQDIEDSFDIFLFGLSAFILETLSMYISVLSKVGKWWRHKSFH